VAPTYDTALCWVSSHGLHWCRVQNWLQLCYGLMKRANFPSTPLRLRMPAPVLELTIIYMKEYHCMRQQCIHQKQSTHTHTKKERSEFKSSPLGLPLTCSSWGSAVECINNSIRGLINWKMCIQQDRLMGGKPLGFPWHGEQHLSGKLNQSLSVQSGMASCAYNCTLEHINYRERGQLIILISWQWYYLHQGNKQEKWQCICKRGPIKAPHTFPLILQAHSPTASFLV
jgi:hypothetical protein